MIESIKIKNFLSFKDEQEISFLATKERGHKPSDSENWYFQMGNTKLLKMLIFIGNNGAGKTNALTAIKYLRHLVLYKCQDIEEKPSYEPFLLDDNSRNLASEISLIYFVNDNRFTYHISVNSDYILEESLLFHDGRSTAYVFKRELVNNLTTISFGNACDLSSEHKKLLLANTLNNTSVLATFASMNLNSAVLLSNYQYFRNHLEFEEDFDPIQLVADASALNDPIIKKVIINVIKNVNIKINDYKVTEHVFDIPAHMLEDTPKSWIERIRKVNPDGKIHKWDIEFLHSTTHGDYPIDVKMESKGTMNMIHIIMLLVEMANRNKSTFIDEFSYSTHQISTDLLLRMFISLSQRSQMIITTQTISLLNSPYLRRDSLRICHKTNDGETKIESINQSKIHKNKNLYNAYLNNEINGLPFVEKDFNFDLFIQGIREILNSTDYQEEE